MTVVRDPTICVALSLEICSLLQKGAIEKFSPLSHWDGFYSTYLLVPKKDGGFWPVLDLHHLNVFLKSLLFRVTHSRRSLVCDGRRLVY